MDFCENTLDKKSVQISWNDTQKKFKVQGMHYVDVWECYSGVPKFDVYSIER